MAKEKKDGLQKTGIYCVVATNDKTGEKKTVYKSHNKVVAYIDKLDDAGWEVKWFNAVG